MTLMEKAEMRCQKQVSETLPLVCKNRFNMDNIVLRSGKILKNVNVGWESYGELNEQRDNVILICHQYSSNSHAAGKYHEDDLVPGYWDEVIGPGKAIDTRDFFVIAIDSLVNLNSKDGITVTTGPATIDPDTLKPYGLKFPIVTIPDFVNVQKALLDSLQIKRLHCVIGFSMGAMQAYQWAAAYPEYVSRIIPISGSADMSAFACFSVDGWTAPIKLDAHWQGGNYYGDEEPIESIKLSFLNLYRQALHPIHIHENYADGWTEGDLAATQTLDSKLQVHQALEILAEHRARNTTDANHMLYMTRALQLFRAGTLGSSVEKSLANIFAKTLVIQVKTDMIFPVSEAKDTVSQLKRNGVSAHYVELNSNGGHLAAITDIALVGDGIRAHLTNE